MNKAEQEYIQPLGLDVGTSRIVVARTTEKKYAYESQLNAFLTLPYSKARRKPAPAGERVLRGPRLGARRDGQRRAAVRGSVSRRNAAADAQRDSERAGAA